MQYMIDRGADPRINDDFVFANHDWPTIDVYKLLLSYGANINAYDSSALFNAILMSKNDCVEFLLQEGSAITEKIVTAAITYDNIIGLQLLHKYQPNNEFVMKTGTIATDILKDQYKYIIPILKILHEYNVDINCVIDNKNY